MEELLDVLGKEEKQITITLATENRRSGAGQY